MGFRSDAKLTFDFTIEETLIVMQVESIPDFLRIIFNNSKFFDHLTAVHLVKSDANIIHGLKLPKQGYLILQLIVIGLHLCQRQIIFFLDFQYFGIY